MGQLSAQDWLTLLYHIRGYLSSRPRPLVKVIGQDATHPPVQQTLSLIGAGHPVDRAADLPFQTKFRQPAGGDVFDPDRADFVDDLFVFFQVQTSVSFLFIGERRGTAARSIPPGLGTKCPKARTGTKNGKTLYFRRNFSLIKTFSLFIGCDFLRS